MARLKLIGTNLLTAVITAGVTSAFWIGAYGNGAKTSEQSPEALEKATETRAPAADITVGPTGLAIPVAGMKLAELVDTYKQARAGGERVHDAIDIMAPHGTPVVAAAPGRVEKLFFSKGGGGISAYIRSEDGLRSYYYAHLQDYAPGLAEGQAVRRGQPIGRVGSTGNANPAGPHLHFAIHRMRQGDRWHGGSPVNPYPLLAGNGAAR